jgi:hypothetical protein
MGTDAECRVENPEPFSEIIDADEGVPAAHGNLHSSSETINVAFYSTEKYFFPA